MPNKTMSIVLPAHVASVLADLAEQAGTSQAQVARWAILTFDSLITQNREGIYVKMFKDYIEAKEEETNG